MTRSSILAASFMLTAATFAQAADDTADTSKGLLPIPQFTGDLQDRSHLTGDWNGTRTDLANKGIQADVDWTQYVQSIVSGGADTGTAYGGHFDYLIHLDLMRMNVLPGALITIRAESRYGQSVNGTSGQVLPVNTTAFFPLTPELDDGVCLNVTDLNYTQFLSEKFAISVGKLDTLDADPNEFASGRGKNQFMNANFIFNSATALRMPYSTLGAAAIWMPCKSFKLNASVINTADSSSTTGFEDFGDGTTASLEGDVQYRVANLPGGMNLGGLYSWNQDFTEVGGQLIFQPGEGLSASTRSDTWAIYWSSWQYLFVKDPSDKAIDAGDGRADHEGLGLFARAGVADTETNPVAWSASAGVGGRGMIPSRINDSWGVGYFYTSFQDERISGPLGLGGSGQGAEAYYNVALTPYANLTFDAQLAESVVDDIDTAVILGMRLNLLF